MRKLVAATVGIAAFWSLPARAGEEPLYQATPAWVEVADLPAEVGSGPIVLMGDAGGKKDIRDALARYPSLKYFYSRFGLPPE